MGVIDNLSSKIENVYDYFANYYFLLFVLVIVIVYTSYNYLGGNTYDYQNGIDTSPISTGSFGIVHIIISFIITIITLWVFIHIINHIFGINILHIVKNIFSNKKLDNIIDSVDNNIIYAEDKIIGLFKDAKKEVNETAQETKEYASKFKDNIKETAQETKEYASKFKDNIKESTQELKENIIKFKDNHKIGGNNEVFNISNNKYTYNDAKSICSAYNSRLATYKEVEDSYNAGGEWCNYGWSDNQLALFPTQESSYNKLQKIKGHENDCGRPGVNGGFIDNAEIRFGVNCYGVKPKPSQKDEDLMKARQIYPKSPKDIDLEKKVDYWKTNLDKVTLSAFNHDKWSRV
jgi:hypothetical protein